MGNVKLEKVTRKEFLERAKFFSNLSVKKT